jgi:hypothetical protein
MADTNWVLTDLQEEIYVKALAAGADSFVLSKEKRALQFLEEKEKQKGTSNQFFLLITTVVHHKPSCAKFYFLNY